MKKIFTSAAFAVATIAATATQAEIKTLGCESDDGSHDFKLTYDTDTNKAILEGRIDVPSPGYSYELSSVIHIVPDPVYQDFFLTIVDKTPDGVTAPSVVTSRNVKAAFEVGTKNYVKIYMNGANINNYDTVICPVPTRAPALD